MKGRNKKNKEINKQRRKERKSEQGKKRTRKRNSNYHNTWKSSFTWCTNNKKKLWQPKNGWKTTSD